MVKGVAIIMMIAHHCFAFPAFWLDVFCTGAITAEICENFKICVSLFAFITGYGFYVGKECSVKDIIVKLLHFLGQYWLQLFLIFIPIASIGYSFSAKKIFFNLFALYDNIMLFAWYVFFHCLVLVTFPLVKRVLRHGLLFDLAMILAGGYCVTVLLYFLPSDTPLISMLLDCSIYYPVVGIGYLTARDNLLNRVNEKSHIKVPTAVVLVGAVLLLRAKVSVIKGFSFDVFYTPLLILALCQLLEKCRFFHPILAFLGKHSFHMWLFHSVFFSAYTREVVQPLINWTDVPILRFVMVVVMSAMAAVLLDKLWHYFTLLIARIK